MFEDTSETPDLEQSILDNFENSYMNDIIANNMLNNINDISSFIENVISNEPPLINEMSRYDIVNINRNNYINIM